MFFSVQTTSALALLIVAAPFLSAGEEAGPDSQDILDKYVQATQVQQQQLRGVSMDVSIYAVLPKLKKKGTMLAMRTISRLGRITYDAFKFEGDNTIKQQLIARYLTAETEVSDKMAVPITPQYYKFKYKGLLERAGRSVHLFALSPRKKTVSTFKGELWLDKETCLPLREAGRMTKNPSVFIKAFDFVRTYEIRDGVAYPKQTIGVVDTRLWGKAEMNVDYSNFSKLPSEPAESLEAEETLAKNQ